MRKMGIRIGIIAVLAAVSGSCNDRETVEKPDSGQTVVVGENAAEESPANGNTADVDITGEGTHIADLPGILSYYPDYRMWGVRHAIPGTIDSVDLYLIKDGVNDLPADTSIEVVFGGDYFPSSLQSPLGGLSIYYISNFTYKKN